MSYRLLAQRGQVRFRLTETETQENVCISPVNVVYLLGFFSTSNVRMFILSFLS